MRRRSGEAAVGDCGGRYDGGRMKRRSETAAVRRSGVTLVELLVVLTILGLIVGISGLALASLRAPREAALVHALREARTLAIRTGRPVKVALDSLTAGVSDRRFTRPPLHSTAVPSDRRFTRPPVHSTALFLPDGRAIGPGVDPLTGAPLGTAR